MAETFVQIVPGRYRHFKGDYYDVIGVAAHVDTRYQFVVYRKCVGDPKLLLRPLEEFAATMRVGGHDVPRFTRIG